MSPNEDHNPEAAPAPNREPAPNADLAPLAGPGALRRSLRAATGYATVVELVPWAGELADARGQKPLRMAADLAGNPRITALSVTDNAGGHARLSPNAPGDALQALGHDVIVHVACRDRNRNALQSLGWDLLSRGLNTVLAISGDYPVEGYRGVSKPVFDVDSVALLAMYRELGEAAVARAEAAGTPKEDSHRLFLGCAIDPTKRLERDLVPQYLKLGLKARSGADYAITQVGYDARKWGELQAVLRRDGIGLPVIANAYILDRGVARAFNAGKVPGCVVTDELLAIVEAAATGPDKGRGFFLELAAKQVVVARGLGFRGAYLCGHRNAEEILRVLELADGHDPADWRSLMKDVSFGLPGAFHLFERDGDGVATDELAKGYKASLTEGARRRSRSRVSPFYRVNRVLHERVFEQGTPGFEAWSKAFAAAEKYRLEKPLHVLEQAVKAPMFDCRDCGDCSLPDIAYLCPESHCQKNQRNGPCGGATDGMCEVPGHTCVWSDAYKRLKPYGEELTMLDRAPVIQDNTLRRTSAWANTFLGRDHFATGSKATLSATAPATAPAIAPSPAATPSHAPTPEKGPSA
jgi:methylenetetrahydrofolate reductase (NADPH)